MTSNTDYGNISSDDFAPLNDYTTATKVPKVYLLSQTLGYDFGKKYMEHGNRNLMINGTSVISDYNALAGQHINPSKLSSTPGYEINVPSSNNYFSFSKINSTY
jgi:hypothetical protein